MYLSMLWRLLQVVQSPDATSHGVVVISWKSQGSLQSDHKNHLKFLNLKWCNISFPGSTSQLQDLHSYMATKLCSHSCLLAKRYAWSFSSPWERIALACTVPKFKQPRLELQDLNTLPNIPQLCMLMLTNLTISPPLQFGVASQKPCVAQYISNIHQNPPNPHSFGHRKPCPTCHDTLAHLWSWRWPLPQEDVVGQHHPSTLAAFPQSLVADCVQQRRSSFFGSMGRSTRELGLWGYGILGVWDMIEVWFGIWKFWEFFLDMVWELVWDIGSLPKKSLWKPLRSRPTETPSKPLLLPPKVGLEFQATKPFPKQATGPMLATYGKPWGRYII